MTTCARFRSDVNLPTLSDRLRGAARRHPTSAPTPPLSLLWSRLAARARAQRTKIALSKVLPWLLSSCAAVAAWLWLLWLCGCCGSAALWPLWLLWVGAMTLLLYTAHVPTKALHIHSPCAQRSRALPPCEGPHVYSRAGGSAH